MLASELRRHNFASSSQDAVQQAQGFFEQKQVEKSVVVKPSMREDTLHDKRVEVLLEIQEKKYQQELALLRSALNRMSSELEMVKAEMRKLAEMPRSKELPQQKEKQEMLKTEEKQAHPRQGNFTSADVDIQKMFYFGNK